MEVISSPILDVSIGDQSWSCIWLCYKPGSRLPLLSAIAMVTFAAIECHCSLVSTKLYCSVSEACVCVITWRWNGHCIVNLMLLLLCLTIDLTTAPSHQPNYVLNCWVLTSFSTDHLDQTELLVMTLLLHILLFCCFFVVLLHMQ